MKILVADDSQVMRRIIVRALRQAGFGGHQVLEAENGREAVELVSREEPDLVLSDWHMPEMDGIEALSTLRATGSAVPFGFVTTEGSESSRRQAAAAGALFVMPKPVTAEAFRQALAGILPALP
jgi:two-component system chemotaxis response regulator CheY